MQSILVIRLSSLGDVILSTPIVRQLQQTYPDAILDVAVASRFAEVYRHNPRVRHVWAVDPSTTADNSEADAVKLSMHESVPGGKYDMVVDLQHNVRSAALRHGLGKRVALAPKYRAQKLAMVWLKKKPDVVTPIVERYREPLADLPLTMDTEGPEVWTAVDKASGAYGPRGSINSSATPLHVAIAPGAQHATKRWPVAKYAELCSVLSRQGARITLLGGPGDVEICNAVEATSGVEVGRADGAETLSSTIAVLDTAHVVVSNDSGVMHLASARRVPVVAIFGSTVKELGFAPYGVRHTIVEHDVGCRPCSHIGRARCPKGHFLCMEGISVGQVTAAIQRMS